MRGQNVAHAGLCLGPQLQSAQWGGGLKRDITLHICGGEKWDLMVFNV